MTKHKTTYKTPQGHPSILPQYLHWYEITDEGYIITKEGSLQCTFGLSLPSNNGSDLLALNVADIFDRWLSGLPHGTGITYEISRYLPEESQYTSCADQMTGAAREIEELRALDFEKQKTYENRVYLTIVTYPTITKDYEISDESKARIGKLLETFKADMQTANINVWQLSPDETVTYLHACVSTHHQTVKLPLLGMRCDLDYLLCDDDICPDYNPMMLGNKYIKVLTPMDITTPTTATAMLEEICTLSARIRWVSRFIVMDKENSVKFVQDKHRRYLGRKTNIQDLAGSIISSQPVEMQNIAELSNADDCALAEEVLIKSRMTLGLYSGFFVVEHESEQELKKILLEMSKIFQKNGIVIKDETLAQFSSWLGSMPGNMWHGYRRLPITSRNFADLIRLSVPFVGSSKNRYLECLTGVGVPLLYGRTYDNTLCYFNPNGGNENGDVGHTALIGKTGSGKSILLAAMAASWLKYPTSRVIAMDRNESALTKFATNQHGCIYKPLIDDTLFQPLQNPNQSVTRCLKFLEAICSVQNVELDADDRQELIKTLQITPNAHATLSVFAGVLRGKNHRSKLVSALENYTATGAYGQLFDADHDTLSPTNFGDVTLIEMSALMKSGDACLIPALAYLMAQFDELFLDRRPTLLILDEAATYLKHPYFAQHINDWLHNLRKMNVFVVLVIQEASGLPQGFLSSILSATHTLIFLPTPNAGIGELLESYRELGTTDAEIQLITELRPKRDYLIKQEGEGVLLANFRFGPEQIRYFTEVV